MILHADTIAALFVDQVAQSQPAAQCAQAAPEPTLKWLMPTIVQTVVSLASITAGVMIAVWSFRKNRQSEHEQWARNQKAEHEQWIRDQAKSEWGAILTILTVADVKLPHVFGNVEWDTMKDGMLLDLRNVLPVMRNAIFISDALEEAKIIENFRDFVS